MRIRLSDLAPGVNYALQIRTTDGTRVSDWSRVFSLLTSSDTIAPKTPAGVTGSMTGTSFNLSWAAVTQSSDNSAAMDLDHYEVLVASAGTGTTKVYSTADTKFQFTFEMNRELFGSPRANIIMSVLARDKTGNASAYSATVDQTNAAPSNVTGLSGTASVDTITLKWTANTDADLAGYQVHRSKTGAAGTYTQIWAGTGTQYADSTIDYFTDHWYRVYAVDVFGTLSATPAQTGGALRPVGSFVLDSTAPAIPTGLAATLTTLADYSGASMAVSWTAVTDTDGDLAGYRIGYRPVGASDWQYTDVDYTNTSTLIDKLSALVNYEVRIRSYDFQANFSNWSSTVTTSTAASNTAPSTPTLPTVASSTQNIQVSIPGTKAAGGAMEADVIYYEVYASSTTGFTPGTTNMVGTIPVGPAMIATFQIPTTGTATTQTWYVKIIAVDKGGLKSPASAQATATPGLILTANIANAQITDAKITDLTVTKLTAGTGLVNDFTVKAKLTLGDASTDGIIESYDYGTSAGATGFRLAKSGLIIKTGAIEAATLKLQNGHNMMPLAYADFEYTDYYYQSSFWNPRGQGKLYNTGSAGSITDVSTSSKVFGSQSATVGNFNPGSLTIRLAPDNTTYNISVEPNGVYYVSAYLRNYGPTTVTWTINIIGNNGATVATANFAHGASEAGFTRRGLPVTIPASGVTSVVVEITASDTTTQKNLAVDGVQFEPIIAGLVAASPWKPPASTTIDGSGITTGYMRSTANINVSGTDLPAWSLNKTGSLQVGDALIRGKLVVGTTSEAPVNRAPGGGDFETDVTGYSVYTVGGTSTAITRTTTGGEVLSGTGTAKVTAAAGSKTNLGISFAIGPYTTGTTVRITGTAKADQASGGIYVSIGGVDTQLVSGATTANTVYSFSYEYLLDTGQTGSTVYIYFGGTTTATAVYFDDISVTDDTQVGNSYVSSPDFTRGSSGWRIYSDGSTEFNNGIFRGRLGANMVTAETLSGSIVLASTIVAGDESGRHVELSDRGLKVWEVNGEQLVDMSTNSATPVSFTGDLVANTLTVKDNMSIRGNTNELTKGASITIQAGTTAPNSPATVSVGWETINKPDKDSTWDPYKYGFAWDANWNGGTGAFLTGQNVWGGNATINRLDKNTGAYIGWSAITFKYIRVVDGGITVLSPTTGTYTGVPLVYGLGKDINGVWIIEALRLSDGASVYKWNYVNNTSRYGPTIGNDGTNLLVAFMKTADRKAQIQTVNATTGAGISVINTDYAMGSGNNDFSFVGKANYDFGVSRIIITRRTWYNAYVYDSAGVKLNSTSNSEDFTSGGDITGMVYCDKDGNGNAFWSYDAVGGKFYRHSNLRWAGTNANDSTYHVTTTWYDSSTLPFETFNVTNKALTSNVATLTTSAAHGFTVGQQVLVAGVDATFNGTYTLTAASGTTLSYAKTATNVTSQAATGTVGLTTTTHETSMGPIKTFTVGKRQSITVTAPPLPVNTVPTGEDVRAVGVYLAKGSAVPTSKTKFQRQNYLADGVRVGYYAHSAGIAVSVPTAGSDAAAGVQPPAAPGTFVGIGGAAGAIRSANDQFIVDGNGVGTWGGISVNSSGNVTIHGSDMTDTGWIDTGTGFTATANCTLNTHWVRRIGKLCMGYFNVTLTNALNDGNFGNITLINVPVGWRTSFQNGQVSGGTAGVGVDGAVTVANGIMIASGNGPAAAGAALSLSVTWFCD